MILKPLVWLQSRDSINYQGVLDNSMLSFRNDTHDFRMEFLEIVADMQIVERTIKLFVIVLTLASIVSRELLVV